MPKKWTMWKKWIEAYNLPRLNRQEIDNWNRWIATHEIELTATTKKGWIHETISAKLSRRAVVYSSQNIKNIWRGGDTPQFILEDHLYWHQKKILQKKKKKCQAKISDNYRCKNLEQNISKLISTRYEKAHTSWPGGTHCKSAMMVQHMQINQSDTPH